jgi:hypothetical protein
MSAAKDHVTILKNLTDRESFRVEMVKEPRAQISKGNGYTVPFNGIGMGYDPKRIATLLDIFSCSKLEIYRLVVSLLELDESNEVAGGLHDYLADNYDFTEE